jgi:LysM repeat protein
MKRSPRLLLLTSAALLAAPAGATAGTAHVVAPGETLWGLAAAQNMTTRAFAAANGLPEDATVVAGSTVQLPTVGEAAGALAQAAPAAPAQDAAASTTTAGAAPAPPAQGGYTVRPGDTLSGLAASSGIPVAQFAQMNGLDPSAPLLSGTVVKLPTGAPAPAAAARPAPAARVVPAASPRPGARPRLGRRGHQHRRRPRRPGVAGRRDRLAGVGLQQRDGLLGQRPRRHAGHAGNVGLGPDEPLVDEARPVLPTGQRPAPACSTCAPC